jgi:hypothetical protein
MHNISSNILLTQSAMPQTIQASAVNTGDIDTQGAGSVSVAVLVGNIVDSLSSSVRIDLKIEHADDDGTGNPAAYAACTDANVLNFTGLSSGVFQSINGNTLDQKRYVIDYIGGLRFVKVTATPVSLTTGGPIALLSLKGNLHTLPANNS